MYFFKRFFIIAALSVLSLQGLCLHLSALSDQEVITYCQTQENTYIAVVWPKGIHRLNYVIDSLNMQGTVYAIKQVTLNKDGIFNLYRLLHRSLSFEWATHYFRPYLPAQMNAPFSIAAIMFKSHESLDGVIETKRLIREEIGCGFTSIHINDTHKETLEAAKIFFNDECVSRLNTMQNSFNVIQWMIT
jgi:hypothetical protein